MIEALGGERRSAMGRKPHGAEQIIAKLREAEVELARGKKEAIRLLDDHARVEAEAHADRLLLVLTAIGGEGALERDRAAERSSHRRRLLPTSHAPPVEVRQVGPVPGLAESGVLRSQSSGDLNVATTRLVEARVLNRASFARELHAGRRMQ
jgi:hypothetical protein